jgi:putative transposase
LSKESIIESGFEMFAFEREFSWMLRAKWRRMVNVFRTVDPHGNADYWATDRLDMTHHQRNLYANRALLIETYHRQFTGIEAGQFRLARSQRNHIGLALRAYVRLEYHRWHTCISIGSAKLDIIRVAVRQYLG